MIAKHGALTIHLVRWRPGAPHNQGRCRWWSVFPLAIPSFSGCQPGFLFAWPAPWQPWYLKMRSTTWPGVFHMLCRGGRVFLTKTLDRPRGSFPKTNNFDLSTCCLLAGHITCGLVAFLYPSWPFMTTVPIAILRMTNYRWIVIIVVPNLRIVNSNYYHMWINTKDDTEYIYIYIICVSILKLIITVIIISADHLITSR